MNVGCDRGNYKFNQLTVYTDKKETPEKSGSTTHKAQSNWANIKPTGLKGRPLWAFMDNSPDTCLS